MISRLLPSLTAALLAGCATAPTVIDPKNDPSNPSSREGSTMVHPISLVAPDTTGMENQKPSEDKMAGMDMSGMKMNPTKPDQKAGAHP